MLIFSKIKWIKTKSQSLQRTCDRFWVISIISCHSAHTIFFQFLLSQTNFLCSRLRSIVSIFHEVSIVHQFSKSFSIFIVQITNWRFSNNIRLSKEDFAVDLNEFLIKLFHALKEDFDALKEDFDALKEDFDCSNNNSTSFSTKEIQSGFWDESSNDMINNLKIENKKLFMKINNWLVLCNTRKKSTKWLERNEQFATKTRNETWLIRKELNKYLDKDLMNIKFFVSNYFIASLFSVQ